MALNSLAGLAGGALVWLVGWCAETVGLSAAMWLLLLGPLALVFLLPRPQLVTSNINDQPGQV
jgi:hypothetical protein